jgi:hypothetical protein
MLAVEPAARPGMVTDPAEKYPAPAPGKKLPVTPATGARLPASAPAIKPTEKSLPVNGVDPSMSKIFASTAPPATKFAKLIVPWPNVAALVSAQAANVTISFFIC